MNNTTVTVADQVAGPDMIIAGSGLVHNDGTIVLNPGASLQENSNQLGSGVLKGAGTIETTLVLNAPSLLNVGGLGLILSTADNLESTRIVRGHTPFVVNSIPSIERFYQIYPTNNVGLSVDMVYTYDDTELNGNIEDDLGIVHSIDGITWDQVAAAINTSSNTISITGMPSLELYTMQSNSFVPLPIELLYFTSTLNQKKQVFLEWATASEVNNDYFELQRSLNGRSFTKIAQIDGKGTSNFKSTYHFDDNPPQSGLLYYRLKQVDYDGEFSFSDIVSVFISEIELIDLYPNPASGYINIALFGEAYEGQRIIILDAKGQMVIDAEVDVTNQYTQLDVSNLSNGVYLVKPNDTRSMHESKFLINR
jgi:hypothetical protein